MAECHAAQEPPACTGWRALGRTTDKVVIRLDISCRPWVFAFLPSLSPRPHLYSSPSYFLREHSFAVRVHPFSLLRQFTESIPSAFLPLDVRSQGRGFISQHDLHWPNLSNPLARTPAPLLCTRRPSQPHCGIYSPCFLGLERRFAGRKGKGKGNDGDPMREERFGSRREKEELPLRLEAQTGDCEDKPGRERRINLRKSTLKGVRQKGGSNGWPGKVYKAFWKQSSNKIKCSYYAFIRQNLPTYKCPRLFDFNSTNATIGWVKYCSNTAFIFHFCFHQQTRNELHSYLHY